jgi:cell division protein FtsB
MLRSFRLFIIIFILFLIFLPGFAKMQELKSRLRDAEDRFRKVQAENAALEDKIAQMRNNTEYMEMVAREKMGVVRKGETILKIVSTEEAESPAANTTATNTIIVKQ